MPAVIDVTEKAAHKAKELLAKRGMPEGALRVKVLAGGCSGMSYAIEPTDQPPQGRDHVVDAHGLRVYLDNKSLLYVAGMKLDYEVTLMSQRFVFHNPLAKTTCSCGESFST